MEGDGSFFLKNLGKSPMFLNGKELASGQSMGLRSSSLIEVCSFCIPHVFKSDKFETILSGFTVLFSFICSVEFTLFLHPEAIVFLAWICYSCAR